MRQTLANVISNKEIAPETHLIWLESARITETARPGQFVMVSCGEDTLLRRPLSIHRVDRDKLAILFKVVGKGTRWLSQCQTGNNLDIIGPLGNGFTIQQATRNILLVAGGIGIAPLSFLADAAIKQGRKATLLMGASSAVHLLPAATSPRGLLPEGVLPCSINIMKTTDDGSEGFKGLVTDLIAGHSDQTDQIFACGPLAMYRTMSKMPELKNRPVQVSLEVRMACGLGICYACTVKTRKGLRQVCRDGPVFDLNDVCWDEVVC